MNLLFLVLVSQICSQVPILESRFLITGNKHERGLRRIVTPSKRWQMWRKPSLLLQQRSRNYNSDYWFSPLHYHRDIYLWWSSWRRGYNNNVRVGWCASNPQHRHPNFRISCFYYHSNFHRGWSRWWSYDNHIRIGQYPDTVFDILSNYRFDEVHHNDNLVHHHSRGAVCTRSDKCFVDVCCCCRAHRIGIGIRRRWKNTPFSFYDNGLLPTGCSLNK